MTIAEWFAHNSFKCQSFSNIKKLVKLKKEQKQKISLCIPTLNEETTIGKTVSVMKEKLMGKKGLLDEIIVIDSGSTDRTKEEAVKAGASFYYADKHLKKYGVRKGKGENLWKSLYFASGDIIVWIDADIKNIHPRFVYGLIGPLLTNKKISFTKAFYRRPIKVKGELMPLGGGRVTELLVRPFFNMYFPELSGFIQPLSGEYASRREFLEKLPFFSGYGVETGLLIDFNLKYGLEKMAQVDLKTRVHRNRSLAYLSEVSFGILQVLAKRADMLQKLILVKKSREKFRRIESKKEDKGLVYYLKDIKIKEKERSAMITLPEYRKKFKKQPKWINL